MKKSWGQFFRRVAATCMIGVAGASAWSTAVCYAMQAMDSASDPAYADGWQAGDNGGSGFTAWNFDAGYIFDGTNYTYATPLYAQIDDGLQGGTQFSNPHNGIGRAWAIGASHQANEGAIHIGRGFSPLQVGQTLKVVFDNPTSRSFFKGYFVRLNGGTGGTNGNICNLGYGCSHPNFPDGYPDDKNNLSTFEYFTNGEWSLNDAAGTSLGVFDTDTAAAGAVYSVTRTGADTYNVLLDSIGPGADFSASRTFSSAGIPVDWIEFVFFNSNADNGQGFSDLTPTLAEPGTDLYISSMMIVPEPSTAALLLGAGTALGLIRSPRRQDSEG